MENQEEISTFTPEAVHSALQARNCPMRVRIVSTLPSTNTALREMAEQGAAEGEVLVALSQSAGKGSLGRSFHSPSGTGLYFSVLLRPAFSLTDSRYLTPAAAVAVARALEQAGGRRMQIKWVNDIYSDGKKVCGILTEAAVDTANDRLRYAIVGVGVNLVAPTDGFPEDIKGTAGAAFEGDPPNRAELLADILAAFYRLYLALPAHGFMGEYRSRSCLVGRDVTVFVGDSVFEGTVQTVDDGGALVLSDRGGDIRTFHSGTVRLKENEM